MAVLELTCRKCGRPFTYAKAGKGRLPRYCHTRGRGDCRPRACAYCGKELSLPRGYVGGRLYCDDLCESEVRNARKRTRYKPGVGYVS